ncbi:Alpha-(1,3)-fucosyltransferase C [Stylophora pistillata]|uniref:Fucosyltransferase n=1 Tax=Stylophora pistillata TaxID=50429 RepID=A0A2B4RZQ1_STYPI|nr:Alpha-(1,3)-fucosyltransferase C [Stylophora pistillata]
MFSKSMMSSVGSGSGSVDFRIAVSGVRHDEIDAFHNHLNEQNTDIQFTREVEENGKLPFLDCLVSHNDNSLRTTVYRKPTHTDRLLDESSYNPTSHKATTIRTLTRRAQLVCDSTDSLSDENKYLHRVFTKNNYNNDFIRRNTHRPTTTTETNDTATPTTTATIPYIKGMSENISRILLPFNIRVAHKPITTLRQLLTNVKDKDEPRNRQGTIYKINCSDCQASYIGETGRNLTTRLTEHRRATRKGCRNVSHYHRQQSFSGLHSPGRSDYTFTERNISAKKTRLVAWATSHCSSPAFLREQFAEQLQLHIPVDILGKCNPKAPRCPRLSTECDELLRTYKFYLAIENGLCEDYITEKYSSQALQHDMVPVVMGGANYPELAIPKSYMNVLHFPSIEKLALYLKGLDQNSSAYNERETTKLNC